MRTNRGNAFDAKVINEAQSDECCVDISTMPSRSDATYAPASPISARRRKTSSITPYVGLVKQEYSLNILQQQSHFFTHPNLFLDTGSIVSKVKFNLCANSFNIRNSNPSQLIAVFPTESVDNFFTTCKCFVSMFF